MSDERELGKVETSKVKIIAIDGPSGGGKSSIAQALAISLDCGYLETGAMYRAAALYILENHIAITHIPEIVEAIDRIPLKVSLVPENRQVFLDDEDVTEELRSAKVTTVVSAVSAIVEVRKKLVSLQRKLVTQESRVVAEGRDIGTVVFPNAYIKFFLTASVQARAERRAAQLNSSDISQIEAEISRRDKLDSSRAASPLKPAHDAYNIDNSTLTEADTLEEMFRIVRIRDAERVGKLDV